jgi:hypothetical protein
LPGGGSEERGVALDGLAEVIELAGALLAAELEHDAARLGQDEEGGDEELELAGASAVLEGVEVAARGASAALGRWCWLGHERESSGWN